MDEAAFVPDDVILSALMPMLATTDGTMIMLSTPWDKGSFFYRAFNSPIWSKYKFKTIDNPLVKKGWLEQQLEMVGEKRYRQEYEGEFVDDEDNYFSMNLLRPCIHMCSDDLKPDETCLFCASNSGREIILPPNSSAELYAGYDPGGMVTPAALVVVQKVPRQSVEDDQEFRPAFKVLLTRTFAEKRTEAKKDRKEKEGDLYTKFDVEIAEIHKKTPFRKLLADSTGIGSPIISHCKELGLPVEGMHMHRDSKEQIFSNLKILLERKKVELPDNYELLSSLNCIIVTPNRIGEYSFSHPSGTQDDLAYALALAIWKGGRGSVGIVMKDEPPKKSSWRVSEWPESHRL